MTGTDVVPPDGISLPELPPTWRWAYLDDLLVRIEAGKNFRCEERPPTGPEYGIVKISAITWGTYDESESKTITNNERVNLEHIIKPGDFLFSRANTIELVGACLIVRDTRRKLLLSDKILRFEFVCGFKNWINWMLKCRIGRRQIEALSTGNQDSMRNIGQERIGRICVPIPPINEQRRIVAKIEELLSDVHKGVEALTNAREQLKAYRQSVLKHAFEGKLTADWRKANLHSGHESVLSSIQTERKTRTNKATHFRPEKHDASFDPHVPEDWSVDYLGNLKVHIFDGPFGSNLKTSDYVESGVRVIRLENIGHGRFIDEKKSFVSKHKYEDIKKHTVFPSDIVFSSFVTAAIRSALVPSHIPFAVNKADCFGVRLVGTTITPKFLQFFFQSRNAFKQVEGMIHGVGRPRINTTQLKGISVPICSPVEQAIIVEKLEYIFSEADALEATLETGLAQLTALRHSILNQAVAGQLVAQDPKDESASALLERIRAERGGTVTQNSVSKKRKGKNARKRAAA